MITLKTTLRRVGAAALGLGLLCAANPGLSQDLDPPTAISVRRDGFHEIGAAFKALNDELKKPQPIPITVKFNASTVAKTSRRIVNWFPVGSGPSSGVKTNAKAEIWTNRAQFDLIAKKLIADAAQMDKLVAAGDMKAVAIQVRVVGADCKSCHEKFRERED